MIYRVEGFEHTNFITDRAMEKVEIELCIHYGFTAAEDVWELLEEKRPGSDFFCLVETTSDDIYGQLGLEVSGEDFDSKEFIGQCVAQVIAYIEEDFGESDGSYPTDSDDFDWSCYDDPSFRLYDDLDEEPANRCGVSYFELGTLS